MELCNNYEHVRVGVVLFVHRKKCDTAIFCHCHTQSVISVNETVETEHQCLAGCQTKAKVKIIILLINDVVYTSVLTLYFSLTESFRQLFIVLHTSTLKTSAKILQKYSFHGASQRTLRQLSSFRN